MTINLNGSNGNPAGVEHHYKTSRRLIRQARYELDQRGDRVQACDKASGAVAHAVKAAAEARHWRHDSHNLRRRIVYLLSAEYAVPDLSAMQDTADKMHDNFYEDLMFDHEVRERLGRVTGLLETFTGLLELPPNPDFVPDPQQERMMVRLRLTPEEIEERLAIEYPPPPPDFEEEEDD